jgi:hypothetical protein
LLKPHFPNAGLKWYLLETPLPLTEQSKCNSILSPSNQKYVLKLMRQRTAALAYTWGRMFSAINLRNQRPSPGSIEFAITINENGIVSDYTILRQTQIHSDLEEELKKTITSIKFRKLKEHVCSIIVFRFEFSLDIYNKTSAETIMEAY